MTDFDDFERLRARLAGNPAWSPSGRGQARGRDSFVGVVVSTGSDLGVGKFALVHPVAVLGAETEGTAATLDEGSTPIPVYMAGPAAPETGDYLVCRYAPYRWVAEKPGPTGPPPVITPFDCVPGVSIPSDPFVYIAYFSTPDGTPTPPVNQMTITLYPSLVSGQYVWDSGIVAADWPPGGGQKPWCQIVQGCGATKPSSSLYDNEDGTGGSCNSRGNYFFISPEPGDPPEDCWLFSDSPCDFWFVKRG